MEESRIKPNIRSFASFLKFVRSKADWESIEEKRIAQKINTDTYYDDFLKSMKNKYNT